MVDLPIKSCGQDLFGVRCGVRKLVYGDGAGKFLSKAKNIEKTILRLHLTCFL